MSRFFAALTSSYIFLRAMNPFKTVDAERALGSTTVFETIGFSTAS